MTSSHVEAACLSPPKAGEHHLTEMGTRAELSQHCPGALMELISFPQTMQGFIANVPFAELEH